MCGERGRTKDGTKDRTTVGNFNRQSLITSKMFFFFNVLLTVHPGTTLGK